MEVIMSKLIQMIFLLLGGRQPKVEPHYIEVKKTYITSAGINAYWDKEVERDIREARRKARWDHIVAWLRRLRPW